MTKAGKKLLFTLGLFLLLTGFFNAAILPGPALASTSVTISVSGNIDQTYLNTIIEKIIKTYNLNSSDVTIKYSDGTTSKYNPNPTPPEAPALQPQPEEPQPNPTPEPDQSTTALSGDEQKMLNLVNQERAKVGLSPLKANLELVKLARLKAQDMINLGYFSHTSPTYGSPFDMIKSAGVSYNYAGENLAGASSVDAAHNNLMNSEGHRANILNSNFKEVGIGIVDGGPYGKMFVQMFKG